VDNSLPQSQWLSTFGEPDNYPEPFAMASENWVPKPFINNESITPSGFQIGFMTVPGYTYTVQYTTSFDSSSQWTNLSSTNGEGGAIEVNATDPATDTVRFYRLFRQPTH